MRTWFCVLVEVDVVCLSYLWKVISRAEFRYVEEKGCNNLNVRDVNTDLTVSLPMVPRFCRGSCSLICMGGIEIKATFDALDNPCSLEEHTLTWFNELPKDGEA